MKVNTVSALAQGFKDNNLEYAYNFPGFYSHNLFNELGESVTSVNEKIAYELAWGSCIAGKRSLVTFKNVGLHDAADPFLNSFFTGVNAGFVIVVFDDINLTGSQAVFDSRLFRLHTHGIWLEPKTVQECYDYAFESLDLSEQSGLPVVIRMSNTNSHLTGEIIKKINVKARNSKYNKDSRSRVVHPINADFQFKKWQSKAANLNSKIDTASVGFNNKDFLSEKILLPDIKRSYSTDSHISTSYFEPLYSKLRNNNYIISVDLGGYTADPNQSADVCLCFGSSTAVAGGIKRALPTRRVAAVIGDAPFKHSGKNVIPELQIRNIGIDIFILDNGGSQGTGGQKIPGDIEKEARLYDTEYIKLSLSEVDSLSDDTFNQSGTTRIFHIIYN